MAENESEIPKRSDKGHSTSLIVILIIVAVFLVIGIPVGIAVVTYWWASQFTEEVDQLDQYKYVEELIVESVTLQGDGSVEACVRNTASVDTWIDAVYKNGNVIASKVNQKIRGDDTTCFTLPSTYADGDEVTLVTTEGTWIRFKVK